MTKSPRANRKLTISELARFLALLAETGNFALACDTLGRAKSGLYKRRVRDAFFDAECVAALAVFRMRSAPERGGGPPEAVEGSNALTLTTYAGRPQLRRAPPGTLTRTGLTTFLQTLAATANVRFAAQSVGAKPGAIYYRRRTNPAFAREMLVAIEIAVAALEMRVIEASGVFADGEADQGQSVATLTASEALHFLTLHSRRRKDGGGL